MQRFSMILLICLTSLTSSLFASYDSAEVERFLAVQERFHELQAQVASDQFDRSPETIDAIQDELQSLKAQVPQYPDLAGDIDFCIQQIEALISPVPEGVEDEEAYDPDADRSHMTQGELALEFAVDPSVAAAAGAGAGGDVQIAVCSKDCTCYFCEFQKKQKAKRRLSPCSYCDGAKHPKGERCESAKAQKARAAATKSRKMKKTPEGRLLMRMLKGKGKRP